jgi:hypothetical protein
LRVCGQLLMKSGITLRVNEVAQGTRDPRHLICPLLSGPKLMIFWMMKETRNAEQEASPGRDYRQAA